MFRFMDYGDYRDSRIRDERRQDRAADWAARYEAEKASGEPMRTSWQGYWRGWGMLILAAAGLALLVEAWRGVIWADVLVGLAAVAGVLYVRVRIVERRKNKS